MSKIIKFVVGIILFIIEGILTVAFVGILFTPSYDTDDVITVWDNLLLIETGISLAVISASGLARVNKGLRFGFVKMLANEVFNLCIMMIGIILMLPPAPVPPWLTVLISTIIIVAVTVSFFIASLSDENTEKPAPQSSGMKLLRFTAEKAKWSFESAAEEYCRHFSKTKDDFTDEDIEKVYSYASMPTAYFLMWLIDNNCMSKEFLAQIHDAELSKLKRREITPVSFFMGSMDCTLIREDISPSVIDFIDSYFYDGCEDFSKCYSHYSWKYMFDYYSCVSGGEGYYYCNEFSWDKYEKIKAKIDERYSYHLAAYDYSDEDEEEYKMITCPLFKGGIDVSRTAGVSDEYADRCIDMLVNIKDPLKQEIYNLALEMKSSYYEDGDEELQKNVFDDMYPTNATIVKPVCDDPALVLYGECEFEPEHGFAMVIRNNRAIEISYYTDASSPFSYENDMRCRIMQSVDEGLLSSVTDDAAAQRLVDEGRLEKVKLSFESVYIPKAAGDILREYENACKALIALGMADRYEIKAANGCKGCIIPTRLGIEAFSGEKRRFSDTVGIYN